MSLKNANNKIKSENKDPIINDLDNYGIKIQCPDCGSIFILNEYGEYFCRKCNRIFSESEIRERYGL